MTDLFDDQRNHPAIYNVEIRGLKERTVSIRAGISWPAPGIPGYYVFVAQLEPTSIDREKKRNRFIAFAEGQETLLSDLFEEISIACNKWRVDEILHGDEPGGEESFSSQLYDYLRKKEEKYQIVQMPSIGKSWRCKQIDFLVQLVRNYIAEKKLILFNISDGRTTILIDKIRNTDMESNILEVPEIKALSHVMDDFDISPWSSPEPVKEDTRSPWAL